MKAMPYKNFTTALYCPVHVLNSIGDLKSFDESFKFIEKHIDVNKVYLETHRSGEMISREKMLSIKKYFEKKGIKTSGGITTSASSEFSGFISFCYTNLEQRKKLKEIVEFTASIFDEIILDDFYFTNCKCADCIEAKGDRSWPEFRTELMRQVSEEIILEPARRVNPKVSMIIKYPNWYDCYQETGYNLADEPNMFDMIYTGTETRDPLYTQQHLPGYLGYFIMRYLENVKPGKNGGGWFDIYECTGNPTSYTQQAQLTLFGKAKEVTLFNMGSLLKEYAAFTPVVGYEFSTLDRILDKLGKPHGTACYIPYHSSGENYLHAYIGTMGIPLEPFPTIPEGNGTLFLTQSAACDEQIIDKIHQKLLAGSKVVVTSGFVKATQGRGFERLANIRCTDRKAYVDRYIYSLNGGVAFGGTADASKRIIIPQLEYATNDTWQLAAALGEDNNFPVLLMLRYGKGQLYVLTVPDDCGDIYNYPPMVLGIIRNAVAGDLPVRIDAPSRVALFVYDNDTFIVRSGLPGAETVHIIIDRANASIVNLATGQAYTGSTQNGKTLISVALMPSEYKAFQIK